MKRFFWKLEIWCRFDRNEIFFYDCNEVSLDEVHRLAKKGMDKFIGEEFLITKVYREP